MPKRRTSRGSARTLATTQFCLNSCSQSGKSCNSSSLCALSSSSILFGFSYSADFCNVFHRNSSLVLPLIAARFPLPNTESSDEDVEEVGEDDVEKCLRHVVFDRWSNREYIRGPRKASRAKQMRVFLHETSPSRMSNSLTFSVISSVVCTSPLAVITVVGLLDVLMVSKSAEVKSFLLILCILAPESTTSSLSSGSFVDAAGSTHSSAGQWHAAWSFSSSL